MMPPADASTTTTKAINAPSITPKISNFFKPNTTKTTQLGNPTSTPPAPVSNPSESCVPPAPAQRAPPITRLTKFTINVPPPPPKPKRRVLEAVEIVTREVDPEEEFFFNPHEVEVQSVSRITAPAGRVEYQITWRDGHTAEVPVSSIYKYISEDDLEKLENDYFKDNRNPETIYDDDPDYPGGAPSGGTVAYERGWLPGQKQTKSRLAPEQRRVRMQMRLGERAGARKRGRPLGSGTSSPGYKTGGYRPTGKNRGRPRIRAKITYVDTPVDGVSSVDERSYSRSRDTTDEGELDEEMLHRRGVKSEGEYAEEEEETQTTYEDELAAQLAAEATIPSRGETPMPLTSDRPQTAPMKLVILSSQPEDEDEIDSPVDAPVHSDPDHSFVLKRKAPPSPNKSYSAEKKIPLPFSPSKTKPSPPKPKAFLSSAKTPRVSHQLPITSMLKRFESPEKKAIALGNHIKVPALTPQLPPSSSPYTGILSRQSSSSIGSFTSFVKGTSSPSRDATELQVAGKYKTASESKLGPPSTTTTHIKPPASEILQSIKVATPTKPSSFVPNTMSFAPLHADSFYTKTLAPTRHTFATAKPQIKPHPTPNSNSKPKSERPKPLTSKPSTRKAKSTSSSWSISSVEDTKMVGIHPGFNPEDYEDFVTQEDYTVEKILAFKRYQGQKLYLVKWEGYPDEQCTWEPLVNLEGSKDLVQDFEKSRLRGG